MSCVLCLATGVAVAVAVWPVAGVEPVTEPDIDMVPH